MNAEHVVAREMRLLGRLLLETRRARGLNTRKAAVAIGVSRSVISRVERGIPCDLSSYFIINDWLGTAADLQHEPVELPDGG
jgi:transcriptional regulator with XRE-family HTH domain